MRITFLGTGTSSGVPVLGCQCKVCRSNDLRDKRFRTAAIVETDSTRILIDAGPDIRMQMLTQPFRKIDGVLLTHIHYDHVGGIDDLRPYCKFDGHLDIYAQQDVVDGLHRNMPYCFPPAGKELYPGAPRLCLHTIEAHKEFQIGDVSIMPVKVMHDKLQILGYRMGPLAYITDMKTIDDAELPYLKGVELLVVNALRWEREHHSHQLVGDAVKFSRRVGARLTCLVHVTHEIGFYDEAQARLPEGVVLAYDGMTAEC